MNRQQHPQVIRAKEMARTAGLDPDELVERRNKWGVSFSEPVYSRFKDAAFDEHFEREAVDNVYWNQGGSFYTDQWDIPYRDGECNFAYGRCKSGRRWFWFVSGWVQRQTDVGSLNEYGWADTEEQALLDGTAAIKRLAAGRRVIARYFHQIASGKLKEINTGKRRVRPPSDATDSKRIEYLYGGGPCRYQIVKKTAKRVYYLKQGEYIDRHGELTGCKRYSRSCDGQIGFVDRQKLEATGEVHHYYYASLQDYLNEWYREDQPPLDLRKLKAEMAAAHPDRGGSSAAFIAARQAYVAARRRLRDDRGRS